ncbi:MAG: PQQ-dependent sugar dehydrogenase [Flavobacteriales bacterium]|nr:hypothetical protein [Flavobacteriales bacterium]MCC6576838.1 PQQ-dependent sugar dehydrogenase [Flavobacteriales bacterium]NUQ14034.1 PQQ-dependent sugar dehydrogenase [Flavobacteriales bacterium]
MRHLLFGLLAHAAFIGDLRAQSVQLQALGIPFDEPVAVTHAGDGRLFVVERPGRIRIVGPDGVANAQPFLDITAQVLDDGNEQGLLGLAFHPNYPQNGYFYVHYTAGTGNGVTRISRFNVSADPDIANPASEVVVFSVAQPYTNHNGGDLHFGPDGHLWFALGDGGSAGDPGDRAQNMSVPFGKVLRIAVGAGAGYSIPADNPFATANPADTMPEIWASGLRNPWRFAFDPANGDVWIGDVGQGAWEEVDHVGIGTGGGSNFGWRCYEGHVSYNLADCDPPTAYAPPVQVLAHTDGHCSVIGGRVYRGTTYPALQGRYIYTDYCQGQFRALVPDGQGGWTPEVLLANGMAGTTAIGTNVVGDLFACNNFTGQVYRIVDPTAVVRLSPKAMLEGPFNTNTLLMNDALRTAGPVPLTEPYTGSGWAPVAGGTGETTTSAVLAVNGPNAVVDWVRLELRSAADPTVIVATRHGLLQRDGDIVAHDGTSSLTFNVGSGSYHVAIRHRNHLGVMTAAPMTLSPTATTLDMKLPGTATYGTDARKEIAGVRVLRTGNVQRDDRLKYAGAGNDRDPVLTAVGGSVPTAVATGYHAADINLDGVVKYAGSANDRDPILVNIGGSVPTAVRAEQLP